MGVATVFFQELISVHFQYYGFLQDFIDMLVKIKTTCCRLYNL